MDSAEDLIAVVFLEIEGVFLCPRFTFELATATEKRLRVKDGLRVKMNLPTFFVSAQKSDVGKPKNRQAD